MSIEAKIAEAVYLVAIDPEALAKVVADPDLLLRSIVAEWPAATAEEIERGYFIADELLKADLEDLADAHRRGAFPEHYAPTCKASRLLSVANGDDA